MASGNVSKGMMLVAEVIQCIDVAGINATREHLQKLYKDRIKLDNPIVEGVITKVSEVTGVPILEIINGTGRANERKIAIAFCAYYLRFSYKFSMNEVQDFLRTEKTQCYRYSCEIIDLKPGHEADKKYCEWKNLLDPHFPKAVVYKSNK